MFIDLLNEELPSKRKTNSNPESTVVENTDPEINEGCNGAACEGNELDDFGGGDDDLNDIDLDSISDEDLADIDEDDLAAIDTVDDLDDNEETLDEDEEVEADQTMSLVATPMLLKDELQEEAAIESFADEFADIVSEGFLLEEDVNMFIDQSDDVMTEARVFAAKTRIQLNEADRRKQLFEVGVQASARAHNDPIYWKLQTVYKLERLYKAKLRQKYRGESLRRVKAYVKKLKLSKSKILSAIADKLKGKK